MKWVKLQDRLPVEGADVVLGKIGGKELTIEVLNAKWTNDLIETGYWTYWATLPEKEKDVFDEQPDGPVHGECAAEIHHLMDERNKLRAVLEKIQERSVLGSWIRIAVDEALGSTEIA